MGVWPCIRPRHDHSSDGVCAGAVLHATTGRHVHGRRQAAQCRAAHDLPGLRSYPNLVDSVRSWTYAAGRFGLIVAAVPAQGMDAVRRLPCPPCPAPAPDAATGPAGERVAPEGLRRTEDRRNRCSNTRSQTGPARPEWPSGEAPGYSPGQTRRSAPSLVAAAPAQRCSVRGAASGAGLLAAALHNQPWGQRAMVTPPKPKAEARILNCYDSALRIGTAP